MDGNGLFGLATGSLALGTGNSDIIFAPNYSSGEKMRINSSGEVGIKMQPGGGFNLSVSGDTKMTGGLMIGQALEIPYYCYHIGDSNTYFGFPNVDTFIVTTNGTERMRVSDIGNVGIGTQTSYAKFTVWGNGMGNHITSANRTLMYWGDGSTITAGTAGFGSVGIYASDDIVTYQYICSHQGTLQSSDQRIKKNIVDADDAECLETLRLLKPKKYEYKDAKRGKEPVWGFISQEVRDTLPYATDLRKDVLPNIHELANVSSSNVITFTNFNTADLESNATTLIRTMGADGIEHDIHLEEVIDGHTIRVKEDLTNFSGSLDATGNIISEITTTTITPEEYEALGIDDKADCVANISGYQNANVSISVEEYNALEDTTGYEQVVQDYTKTYTIYPGNQLFVYGQQVDDFVFLKKEAIWTIATAALQEVDRQLQAEKAKVADLLARVTALENA
jgi:hypothetical protein